MTPQCRHCRHSEGRASMLAGRFVIWCVRHQTVPVRVCGDYSREPGSDDE